MNPWEKTSDADKKENFHYFKTTRDPVAYERIRKRIRFPKYYPALFFFIFNDDKMYVQTYKVKDGKVEFYIFDLKGKLLKQRFLPLVKRFTTAFCPYTFKNDNLYHWPSRCDYKCSQGHHHTYVVFSYANMRI